MASRSAARNSRIIWRPSTITTRSATSELALSHSPLAEIDVRKLHALVMHRSDPEIAGRYATASRYVNTDVGRHRFPSPTEVPAFMGHLAAWLRTASATPETALTAHHRLVDIHPFNDGNGRTARLLMNLLIRGGYPPVSVRPEGPPRLPGRSAGRPSRARRRGVPMASLPEARRGAGRISDGAERSPASERTRTLTPRRAAQAALLAKALIRSFERKQCCFDAHV